MLKHLIALLEKAEEGSRELELEIALAIDHKAEGGQPRWRSVRAGVAQDGREKFTCDRLGYVDQIPRWTRSLDAALTLVPELVWVQITSGTQRPPTPSWEWPIIEFRRNSTDDLIWRGQAKTIPLALCIAALRARADGEG